MPISLFSSRTTARLARRLVLVTATVAGAVVLSTAPALAATDVPDAATSALITRLTVADGRGWMTVQVRIAATRVVGFEAHVPAKDDGWSGAPDVFVRELGVHCRSVGTRSLAYVCGDPSAAAGDAPYLPLGGYQVTLPVFHTGTLPTPGLFGHTWVDAVDAEGQARHYGGDSFPVVDASHFFSTAEIRSAPLVADPDTTLSGTATVPVSMTVVPGEQVAALDVSLPGKGAWSMIGTNALPQGASCSVVDVAAGARALHCVGQHGAPLPVGRYQLVSTLRFTGPDVDGHWTRVSLTMVGGVAERTDNCHFHFATSV